MKFKKTFVALIFILILAIGFLVYKAENIVPSTVKFADFGLGASDGFYFGTNTFYKNKELIKKYFDLNKNKSVKRVSFEQAHSVSMILVFSYNSDKGRDSSIDDKGRIYFAVSKHEIRNKSRLHWLWWKLDPEPHNYIYYATNPDPMVVEVAKQIEDEIRNK